MQRKVASALGLMAFAVMAAIGALGDVDFSTAVARSVIAAVVMALVGYVAGYIAEMALREAVDSRIPLRPEPKLADLSKEAGVEKEDDK